MLDLYWGCLFGGLAFGLISLLFGDLLGDAFDGIFDALSFDSLDFLHPMTIVSAITMFGGIGVLLTQYSSLEQLGAGLIAGGGAVIFSIAVFFVYVKPMKRTESSIGYSMAELVGRPGEVTIPIPKGGYGEVEVSFGVQKTYQLAAAYDQGEIAVGARVVVVEVREGTVYVTAEDYLDVLDR